MTLTIKNQEHYSRGELLLRTIFGPLYITLPHVFLLFFVGLWGAILFFVAFLVVVFTGSGAIINIILKKNVRNKIKMS